MLIDLSQAVGSYLHEVFVAKFQWWVLLGYVAQIMFTMRFVVQWIASERAGKMVMPIAFWFFSIGGGVLLFGLRTLHPRPGFHPGSGLRRVRLCPQSLFRAARPAQSRCRDVKSENVTAVVAGIRLPPR